MSYIKTNWTERIRQFANRFILTPTGTANEYDIQRVEGTVTQNGVPLSISNLNKIEQGIYDAHKAIEEPLYSDPVTSYDSIISLPSVANGQFSEVTLSGASRYNPVDMNFATWAKSAGFTESNEKALYGTTSFKCVASASFQTIAKNFDYTDATKYYIVVASVYISAYTDGTIKLYLADKDGANPLTVSFNATLLNQWQTAIIKFRKTGFSFKVGNTGAHTHTFYADGFMVQEVTQAEYEVVGNETALLSKYNFITPNAVVSTLPERVRSLWKNLIDPIKVLPESGVTLAFNSDTQTYTSSTTGMNKFIVIRRKVIPGQQYTIKRVPTKVTGQTNAYGNMTVLDIYGGYIVTPTASLTATFTPAVSEIDIKIQISGGFGDLTTGTITEFQLEKGSATAYEPYTYTEAYINPSNGEPLRSLPNGVEDEFNALTGVETRNVSGDIVLASSSANALTNLTNNQLIRFPLSTLYSNIVSYSTRTQNQFGWVNIHGDNQSTGTTLESRDLIENRGKFFLYVDSTKSELQFIVASGTYTDLANAQANFPSKTLNYQLSTPIIKQVAQPAILIAKPNGSIIVEHVVSDFGFYDTVKGMVISNRSVPVKSLDIVLKIDKQSGEETDITSTCTKAVDGLSFTSTALADGDLVWFAYYYDSSLSTQPGIMYSYPANHKAQTNSNTDAIGRLGKTTFDLERKMKAVAGILVEISNYNVYSTNKDANGIFITTQYKRMDGTLYLDSTLSGGTTPKYTTCTWKVYDTDGVTEIERVVWTLSYDSEGKITSKVVTG